MVEALKLRKNRRCMTEVNWEVVCTGGAVFPFCMILWAKKTGVGQSDLSDGKGVEGVGLSMQAVSCTR